MPKRLECFINVLKYSFATFHFKTY